MFDLPGFSDSFFWQRMAACLYVVIIGTFTRQQTTTLYLAMLSALLGTDYTGVFIASTLVLVPRIVKGLL